MKQRSLRRKNNSFENPLFASIRNKSKLKHWLLRQYFNSEKNADSPWYDKRVNAGNVLKYVSDPGNCFPLTPHEIVDMFSCIERFKKSLKKSEEALGPNLGLKTSTTGKAPVFKYQTGEVTLEKIGQSLGGLTPTMINKLATSGMDKIRKLANGSPIDDLGGRDADRLDKFIMDCRIGAALEFADELKVCDDVNEFINKLVKKRTITSNDVKIMAQREVVALQKLASDDQGSIVQTLLRDISKDDNIFKTYQSAVSKKAFPEKKRGRPKKEA